MKHAGAKLFCKVQEYLAGQNQTARLRLKPDWYTDRNLDYYRECEKRDAVIDRCLADFCDIMDIDYKRLIALTKCVSRHEKKSNWQNLIQMYNHNQRIMKYLANRSSDDLYYESTGRRKKYIN